MGRAGKLIYIRLDTLAKNQAYDYVKWGGGAERNGEKYVFMECFLCLF